MMLPDSSGSGGNNPLNLFPSTITPQQAQAKVQRLTYTTFNRAPTHIQTILASTLYDDGLQYMTTLDMNRAASYTFGYRNAIDIRGMANSGSDGGGGECIAEEMWQLLLNCTLQLCTQHSILAITKTLHLLQHVLLHGSEACVLDGQLLYRIEMIVEPLRHLNTALLEQKMLEQILNNCNNDTGGSDTQGGRSGSSTATTATNHDGIVHQLSQLGSLATATIMKIRGGSVDKGHPVRVAACKVYDTVHTPNVLRQLRYQQQPSSSLVPIGSSKQVGYITDDARYRMLQERVIKEETTQKQKEMKEKQQYQLTKSNLAGNSATNSFGGGYTSGGGTSTGSGTVVVGAAHSLADMIASAKYELEQHKATYNKKILALQHSYVDDPYTRAQQIAKLEAEQCNVNPEFRRKEKALQDALDYLEEMQQLEVDTQHQQVILEDDLLGVGGTSSISMSSNNNGGIDDLLGFDDTPTNVNNNFTRPLGVQGHNGGNMGANNNADLLGFDNLSDGYIASSNYSSSSIGYYDGNNNSNLGGGYYPHRQYPDDIARNGDGISSSSNNNNMRPSLVTGIHTTTTAVGLSSTSSTTFNRGLNSSITTSLRDDDEKEVAEQLRKVNLAEGLFAGVSGSWCDPNYNSNNRSNINNRSHNVTATKENDNISAAFDNNSIISTTVAETSFNLNPSAIMSNNVGGMNDTYSICDIGNPMGGSNSSIIHDNYSSMIPPPAMPPHPPPSMPPPPPPPTTTGVGDGVANSNPFGSSNLSVEQMQEMIRQQQAQMTQMMALMQQMQGNNMPPS